MCYRRVYVIGKITESEHTKHPCSSLTCRIFRGRALGVGGQAQWLETVPTLAPGPAGTRTRCWGWRVRVGHLGETGSEAGKPGWGWWADGHAKTPLG